MYIGDVETVVTIISFDLSKIVFLVGPGSSLIIWEGSTLTNSRIPISVFHFCIK